MVPMRDGVRLNTFVYLPNDGAPSHPVILQRTPYGITAADAPEKTDCTRGWLPAADAPMRGSILRGWCNIVDRGYVAVYQDTRGRNGSEGEDRVYADDASDGYDTLDWIARQPWCNGRIGMSGSSAGATTTFAAASQGHPSLKAFFAQVGGSSIYDDVVYEGGAIEMERLWLWVAQNVPGLSTTHRARAMERAGISVDAYERAARATQASWERLQGSAAGARPFVDSEDWLRLPLRRHPAFSVVQPFLDEILAHPLPDDFRRSHDFRSRITIPGFHATTWYDIFLTSVISAFQDIQSRVGNQKLWIGPNHHYFIYESRFWPRDPYFEWFGHWLKDEPATLIDEPAVYYDPRAWIDDDARYIANAWKHAEHWPPRSTNLKLHLRSEMTLLPTATAGPARDFVYDPRKPIPTHGGRNMLIAAGQRDQQPVRRLPHYGLVYRSEPLPAPLTIAGEVRVTLHASSDCPDTDFVVKLIEHVPDGPAILLMDGVARAMLRGGGEARPLGPDEVVRIDVSLAHLHHTVAAGHRIEIDITGSNFPRRARNTNSGNLCLAADDETCIRVATNTIHHDPATPSFVEIPILVE